MKPQELDNGNQKAKIEQNGRFIFTRKQMIFHRTLIGILLIAMLIKYMLYARAHIEQISEKVELTPFSHFFEVNFNLKLYRYKDDLQWEAYRSNLPVLAFVAFSYWLLVYCAKLLQRGLKGGIKIDMACTFEDLNGNIYILSLAVIFFTFRADAVLYLGIILAWWLMFEIILKLRDSYLKGITLSQDKSQLNSKLKKINQYIICLLFCIMLITLYLNQQLDHFRELSDWFSGLLPQILEQLRIQYRAIHCSQLLNMTFLRLISYSVDRLHESDQEWESAETKMKQKKFKYCQDCFKSRDAQKQYHCPAGRDFIRPQTQPSLRWYLNYTLFTPTLLTGPPTSYRSFMSFSKYPAKPHTFSNLSYMVFLVLLFEVYQILFPCLQPSTQDTPLQTVILSLFTLVFIWFKYLIIWRVSRAWALLCGVDVIDNMSRCICDNYGFEGFWRMWHRGFNQWLIRYIYIPIGGKNNVLVTVPVVVAFVAFWHDHTLGILVWAAVLVCCMVPELVVKAYFRKYHSNLYPRQWFKYLCAISAAFYIYLLVVCNLVGFGGYDSEDIGMLLNKIYSSWGWFVITILILASACILMFERRDKEGGRKGY